MLQPLRRPFHCCSHPCGFAQFLQTPPLERPTCTPPRLVLLQTRWGWEWQAQGLTEVPGSTFVSRAGH